MTSPVRCLCVCVHACVCVCMYMCMCVCLRILREDCKLVQYCKVQPHLLRLGALHLANTSTNTPLVTVCHWLFTCHYQSLLERVSVHTKFAGKSKHCCGGSGGGSRGGPVASFTRTTLNHSSLQRHAPRHGPIPGPQSHAVGTDQCAIFRIVAISTIFSTCHCLSSIITAWHLSSLKRMSIVSYYSLERASIISIS